MGRNHRRVQQPRTDFALDGRRLAGVAAAAAIVAAIVFVAGLEVGRGAPEAELAAPADRLDLLDEAERIAAQPPAAEPVDFHRVLTSERTEIVPVQAPKARPAPAAKRAPAPLPAPAPAAVPAAAAPVAAAPAAKAQARSAPAPRASPEPPPASPWSIQLGASTDPDDAKRLAARHPGALVVSADVDGRRWYRVRLSGFASRGDAQAALARLERETGARGFVTGR
jgi:septal ring-binding cell division protein DamX